MEAANDMSAEPMVETSWPDHIRKKLRLRNTENGETAMRAAAAIYGASYGHCMQGASAFFRELMAAALRTFNGPSDPVVEGSAEDPGSLSSELWLAQGYTSAASKAHSIAWSMFIE